MSYSIQAVRTMDKASFTALFGSLFEHSPWVAERSHGASFGDLESLHGVLSRTLRNANAEEQMQVIQAHPDLAGKLAQAGRLTDASNAEQASAGLDHLSEVEVERFTERNDSYQERFGFPFIICVKEHDKAGILTHFETRLKNERDAEIDAALFEIERIAWHRLSPLIMNPKLSTHVLDTSNGRPAGGMTLTLLKDGEPLKTLVTNDDGRTDELLLSAEEMAAGQYAIRFNVADYFRAQGVDLPEPPFLDVVTLDFGISDATAGYHVPLLCSPWSYSTYRGS